MICHMENLNIYNHNIAYNNVKKSPYKQIHIIDEKHVVTYVAYTVFYNQLKF